MWDHGPVPVHTPVVPLEIRKQLHNTVPDLKCQSSMLLISLQNDIRGWVYPIIHFQQLTCPENVSIWGNISSVSKIYYIEFGSKTLSAAHIIVVEIVYFVKHLQCFLQYHNCRNEKSKRDLIMFLISGLSSYYLENKYFKRLKLEGSVFHHCSYAAGLMSIWGKDKVIKHVF